jgi:hypothetical protein
MSEVKDDFLDPDATDPSNSQTVFYIDSTSISKLLATLLLLIAINVGHVLAAGRAPALLSSRERTLLLNPMNNSGQADFDLRLSNLAAIHRFIDVNCTLVRRHLSAGKSAYVINASSDIVLSRNFTTTAVYSVYRPAVRVSFSQHGTDSSAFHVTHKDISDFDTVDVRLTLSANLDDFRGITLHWSFVNPVAVAYVRAARALMSGLMLFAVLLFASKTRLDSEVFTQIFCLFLGVSGAFGSNPASLIAPAAQFSDHVLLAGYTNLLRLFYIVQFDMLRRNKPTPSLTFFLIAAVFFSCCVGVDASAAADQLQRPDTREVKVAIIMVGLYGATAAIQFTAILAAGASRRALIFFLFVAADVAVNLLTQIYVVLAQMHCGSVLPSIVCAAVPMTSGAFAILLMHRTQRTQYQVMKEGQTMGGSLDVEALSGGGIGEQWQIEEIDEGYEEIEEDFE